MFGKAVQVVRWSSKRLWGPIEGTMTGTPYPRGLEMEGVPIALHCTAAPGPNVL